ncbi:MAG: hypothetical protein AAFU03_11220 [Bacteroidota bacterium]
MPNDKKVTQTGAFTVNNFPGGTFDNVILEATKGGSIHVTGQLIVNDELTIVADHSGTILLPAKVSCGRVKIHCSYSSTVNSNDLEVTDSPSATIPKPFVVNADHASTCGLYTVISGGQLNGSVQSTSTVNLYADIPSSVKISDQIRCDHTSDYTRRGWSGPQ